jgi:transketolase
LILLASGSEAGLIMATAERLQQQGIVERCVSMPRWELFKDLPKNERDTVPPPPSVDFRLAVEMGVSQGWSRYVSARGDMLGVERFGAPPPPQS